MTTPAKKRRKRRPKIRPPKSDAIKAVAKPKRKKKRKRKKKVIPANTVSPKDAPKTKRKKTMTRKQVKANQENGKKGGRPRVPIDWDEFNKLCYMQATLEEISSWYNCGITTIEERVREEHGIGFREYWRQKSDGGKISLRRAQFQKAIDEGHPTMLIWLGKNVLNQADKQQTEITGKGGGPITWVGLYDELDAAPDE